MQSEAFFKETEQYSYDFGKQEPPNRTEYEVKSLSFEKEKINKVTEGTGKQTPNGWG